MLVGAAGEVGQVGTAGWGADACGSTPAAWLTHCLGRMYALCSCPATTCRKARVELLQSYIKSACLSPAVATVQVSEQTDSLRVLGSDPVDYITPFSTCFPSNLLQVSEQTDSLRVLGSDPVDYLITPRVLACMIAVPILNLLCFCMGACGCNCDCSALSFYGVCMEVGACMIAVPNLECYSASEGLRSTSCRSHPSPCAVAALHTSRHGGERGAARNRCTTSAAGLTAPSPCRALLPSSIVLRHGGERGAGRNGVRRQLQRDPGLGDACHQRMGRGDQHDQVLGVWHHHQRRWGLFGTVVSRWGAGTAITAL